MKKATEKKAPEQVESNMMHVCGIVSFVSELKTKDGNVWGYTIGVKVPYTGTDKDGNPKEFTAYPAFKLFTTEMGEPEKGDNIEFTAHFETHKFKKDGKDVYNTDCVIDNIR